MLILHLCNWVNAPGVLDHIILQLGNALNCMQSYFKWGKSKLEQEQLWWGLMRNKRDNLQWCESFLHFPLQFKS